MCGWDSGITSATLWQGPAEKVIRPHIWVALLKPSAMAVKGYAMSELFIVTGEAVSVTSEMWPSG